MVELEGSPRHPVLIFPLLPVHREEVLAIARALPAWFTESGIGALGETLERTEGFIADDGTRIVGFLTFEVQDAVARITWMGVLPTLHRQGIGKRLIDLLVKVLRVRGIRHVRVWTLGDSVDYEPYARTRAFYRTLGFRDFRRVVTDNPECPEELHLELALT